MDQIHGVGGGAYLGLEKDSFAIDDSMMYSSPGRFQYDPNSSMQIVEETRTPGNPYGVDGDKSLPLGASYAVIASSSSSSSSSETDDENSDGEPLELDDIGFEDKDSKVLTPKHAKKQKENVRQRFVPEIDDIDGHREQRVSDVNPTG